MMKQLSVFNAVLNDEADNDLPGNNHFWIEAEAPVSGSPVNRLGSQYRDFYCVSLLYYGTVHRVLKCCTVAFNAPAVLLLEPGELPVHAFSADCLAVSLCFSPKFLEKQNLPWNSYLNEIFMHSIITLGGAQITDYHKYFSQIIQEHQQNDAKAPAVISNLLMMIFKMIANVKVDANHIKNQSASRLSYFHFKTLIEQHFKKQHHVQAYADQLCMTAEMLGKIVRDTVNKTPKQLIDERLITEVKRMLLWTNRTNKEIAYDLGFESDSYFNRYFKKHCHQTPFSFRLRAEMI